MKATRTGNSLKGTWTQLTYSFELTRVLMKPQVTNDADEASACNLRGITIEVIYRDKSGVNLADLAGRMAEKLRATNALVKIEKGNNKDFAEKVVFNNGQSEIAARVAQCVSDLAPVTPFDNGVGYLSPNVVRIFLQSPPAGAAKTK